MTARILDGEALAARFRAEITDRVARLVSEGVRPGLGTILVGDDPASERYVALEARRLQRGRHRLGPRSTCPPRRARSELEAVIRRFNADPAVHAYLVQLPLPKGLDEEAALLAVDDAKDVDGLHPVNLGRLVMGAPGPLPCTPAGIVELLHAYDVPVEGRHVVVIGRGITIGRPLALLLALKRPGCNAAVTVVHTGRPRPRRLRAAGRHRGGGGRLARAGHARHGQARGRPWSGRARPGRAARSCPTSRSPWPRWRDGSPPGSAAWAP